MRANESAEGAACAERALDAAGPSRLVEVIAEAMNTRGVCLQTLNRLDEGIALIRAAADLAAAHDLSAAEIRARFNLGGRLFADDPVAAERELQAAFAVALRPGRKEWLLATANFLAGTRFVLGQFDAAIAVLDDVPDDIWSREERGDAIETRAYVARYRGERERSAEMLAEARELVADSMNNQRKWSWAVDDALLAVAEGRLDDARRAADGIGGNWQFWAFMTRLHVALRRGDVAAAREILAVPSFLDEQGATMDTIRRGLEACVHALEGDRDRGVAELRDARRRARDLGIGWLFGDVLIDAIHDLGPDDPEAAAIAAEAREAFEGAGDRLHVARLDEALGSARADSPTATRDRAVTPTPT
jgi:hypothetical protein